MSASPPREYGPANGTGEESDSERAVRFAKLAMDHALSTHELVGQLAASTTRQILELTREVRSGFAGLGVKMRAAQTSIDDAEEEITAVRNLRVALKKAKRRTSRWIVGSVSTVFLALVGAYVASRLGLHP